MVSSLIGPQYHDGQFWKFSVSASQGSPNNFDTPVVPAFAVDFEVIHRIEYNFSPTTSFSMLTSTEQMTALSSMMARTQVLDSSAVLRSLGLNCKISKLYVVCEGQRWRLLFNNLQN